MMYVLPVCTENNASTRLASCKWFLLSTDFSAAFMTATLAAWGRLASVASCIMLASVGRALTMAVALKQSPHPPPGEHHAHASRRIHYQTANSKQLCTHRSLLMLGMA